VVAAVSSRAHRWISAENERRLRAYQETERVWAAGIDAHTWHSEQARLVHPVVVRRTSIVVKAGEKIIWETPHATMFEVPDGLSLFKPVHSLFSPLGHGGGHAPILVPPSTLRSSGEVVVTTRRVIFSGPKGNREWLLAKLTGVAHSTASPSTVMRVDNRQRLSGLLFEAEAAYRFQFYLSLALAEAQNDLAGFRTHLAQSQAYHESQRPAVPPPAHPSEVPSVAATGWRSSVRLLFGPPNAEPIRRFGPSLGAVMLLAMLIGAVTEPPPSSDPGSNRVAQDSYQTPVPSQTWSPSPLPAPPSPTLAPVVENPVPLPKPTTQAPPAQPKGLCGAPQNPFGYTFCSGSNITSPPDDFCSYFACIDNFWKSTNGYVVQCKDGMFSHSGGRQGVCSYHDGQGRALKR
jgi:hypothetical protein